MNTVTLTHEKIRMAAAKSGTRSVELALRELAPDAFKPAESRFDFRETLRSCHEHEIYETATKQGAVYLWDGEIHIDSIFRATLVASKQGMGQTLLLVRK